MRVLSCKVKPLVGDFPSACRRIIGECLPSYNRTKPSNHLVISAHNMQYVVIVDVLRSALLRA